MLLQSAFFWFGKRKKNIMSCEEPPTKKRKLTHEKSSNNNTLFSCHHKYLKSTQELEDLMQQQHANAQELTTLTASKNYFESFDAGKYPNLNLLSLSQNNLQQFPVHLLCASKLTELYLCNNRLQEVSSALLECVNLKVQFWLKKNNYFARFWTCVTIGLQKLNICKIVPN